jgi:drug/metabolite transporter (DMT)-like permease
MTTKKHNFLGLILLFTATLAWGTSFIILKETISSVSTFYVLAIRFTVSSLLIGAVFFKTIIKTPLKTILSGVVLGIILTFAYDIQTFGLAETSAARNAFLTGFYCILTPFMAWLIIRKKPSTFNVIAAFLCIIGIGFVVFSGSSDNGGVLIGDLLTLLAAVFYALQIIFIDKYQEQGQNSIQLLVFELLTVGVCNIIFSIIFDMPKGIEVYALNFEQILQIGYLTLACTLMAQFCMIIGQKLTTANQASVILSLESVFGALFSVLLGKENLTVWLIIGFVIIFIAIYINELKQNPFKNLLKKDK